MIVVDNNASKFKGQNYYHLLTDNIEDINELHDFAINILGLKKDWFQDNTGDTPHYDISETKKQLALKKGAKEVDNKELVSIIKKWRMSKILIKPFVSAETIAKII